MALYEEFDSIDVIGPVRESIERSGYILCEDGKIRPYMPRHMTLDSPWINAKVCPLRHCYKWHKIYFNLYDLVPRGCLNCFKIVTRPQTLKDLFKMHKLQAKWVAQEEDFLPCKCGIERRKYTKPKGLYGAYFYCPLGEGVEVAREWHKKVERLVHREFGIHYKVILKRGCTEMENAAGPSNKWEYNDAHARFEDLLDAVWEVPKSLLEEPIVLRPSIFKTWIEHGLEHKDKTALEYVERLEDFTGTPTVFYHDKKVEIKASPELGRRNEKEYVSEGVSELSEGSSGKGL